MRYIDIEDLKRPTGWQALADAAAVAVAGGGDPNDHGTVWRNLKKRMAKLLYDKCWFCETPIERSDNAVDHFRPKNRVSDAANPHNGYRWLAFEYHNFRYACTFCNSRRIDLEHGTAGGKADRFPLINEANRLYAPGNIHQEEPMILDPCNLDDWELLGCQQENGEPCPTSADPIKRQRADTSIEVYHLDYEPSCKRRHGLIVNLLSDIADAKRHFDRIPADPTRKMDFDAAAKKIKRAIRRKAPHSGEMIFILKGQRHANHPWIQRLLEA